MLKITITVAGPGGCISPEMRLLHSVLVASGYDVTVIDQCPALERTEYNTPPKKEVAKWPITLVADHLPWGG